VKKPLQKAVMMDWLDTRGCEVIKEDTDTVYVKIDQPCPHLLEHRWKNGTSSYSCEIYKSRPEGCQVFDGRKYDFLECSWKDKFVVLEKSPFKMAKQQRGEEEVVRQKKERKESGDWTPSQERLRERAKRRKEEQEPPEV
jgi:Fe-S-cluster containining protein